MAHSFPFPPTISLSQKTALVTGGSRGIGRAISLELAARGARVAIVYASNDEAARETVGEMEKLAAAGEMKEEKKKVAMAIKADLADLKAYGRIVEEMCKGLGCEGVDILVHSAGVVGPLGTSNVTPESYAHTMAINLQAPFFLTQAVAPLMPSSSSSSGGGGRIILISSTSARLQAKGFANAVYAASKAGLESLAREWAYEFGERGITVNAVQPGFTDTDFSAGGDPAIMQMIKQNYGKATPLGRIGQPEDVAPIVAFLASEGARYVTGCTVTASGGRVCF